jgi:hypothetical protein
MLRSVFAQHFVFNLLILIIFNTGGETEKKLVSILLIIILLLYTYIYLYWVS